MKPILLTIFLLLIIFVPSGVLFYCGEKVINEEANKDFYVLNFENSKETLKEKDSLNFSLHNAYSESRGYSLSFFLDGEEIEKQTGKLSPGKKEMLFPSEQMENKLKEILTRNESAEYKIKVVWDKKGKELEVYKTIKN